MGFPPRKSHDKGMGWFKWFKKRSNHLYFQEYKNEGGEVGKFKDSQFLVFVNRILAFCLAGLYLAFTRDNKNRPIPMYKYLLCSLSNILSSFCQYEALKYVTFPLQVATLRLIF